jgi:hypothetical protein
MQSGLGFFLIFLRSRLGLCCCAMGLLQNSTMGQSPFHVGALFADVLKAFPISLSCRNCVTSHSLAIST